MSHVIDYADDKWIALVDPQGPTPQRAKLTPACTELHSSPPVYSLAATWPGYVQLSSTLPQAVLTPAAQDRAHSLLTPRTDAPWTGDLQQALPEGFAPYPWQVAAAVQYARTGALLLGDEPGLGKTFSAALAVLERWETSHGSGAIALVIAPASVVSSWISAWSTLTQDAPVSVLRYMGVKRSSLLEQIRDETAAGGHVVLVTSYETASRDIDTLSDLSITDLIIDEHHLLKSPKAARSKAVRRLAAKLRPGVIALSGTPITRHAGDLWAVLSCLEPEAYPSRGRFDDRYLDVVSTDYGQEVAGFLPHRRPEFDLSLIGVERRVTKEEALPWLPPKRYSVREVEMPAAHAKAYRQMRDDFLAKLPDSGEVITAMSVLPQIAFLQAMAAAPCDVEVREEVDEGTEHYSAIPKAPSWKVAEMLAVLDERLNEQVVVFTPSKRVLDLAAAALDERGTSYGLVVGGQSSRERDEHVAEFQAGQRRVMLATTGAGGVGITLTAASCVVFLARPWSIVESVQAEDRCHRIGSEIHGSIDIVDIVTVGTIDGAIRGRLREKGEALGDVFRDPEYAAKILGGQA